ncbi:hypothetical protein [Citrobacter amalonaticus]|uniref:hypothetical protein n=1 Tax=Citrobacter amalonaticus TaxID=35703 RepID=UPI001A227F71|nr:hypothetical protein [Citrobacter amalonaticus]HDQ2814060.1 hypothetical protein [Citrobacter amalonaticus]
MNDKEGVSILNDVFSQITPDVFRHFLIERKANKKCLSCGARELRIPTANQNDDGRYYVWFQPVDSRFGIEPANAQYIVVCTRCGHISHYHSMMVIEWYKALNNSGVGHE